MPYEMNDKVILFYSETDNQYFAVKVNNTKYLNVDDKITVIDNIAVPICSNFNPYTKFSTYSNAIGKNRKVCLSDDNIPILFRFKKPSVLYLILNRYTYYMTWTNLCKHLYISNQTYTSPGGYTMLKTYTKKVHPGRYNYLFANDVFYNLNKFNNMLNESIKGFVSHISVGCNRTFGVYLDNIPIDNYNNLILTHTNILSSNRIKDYNIDYDLQQLKNAFDDSLQRFQNLVNLNISVPKYVVIVNYNHKDYSVELNDIINQLKLYILSKISSHILIYDSVHHSYLSTCEQIGHNSDGIWPRIDSWVEVGYNHFYDLV